MIKFENAPEIIGSHDGLFFWLHTIADNAGFTIKDLSYTFVDNPKILEINRQFLNHDYFTDIISFDYCRGRKVVGEIFISSDQVALQADELGVELQLEFLRVIVHGLLHMIGFDDSSKEEKQKMREEEEKCLLLHSQIAEN